MWHHPHAVRRRALTARILVWSVVGVLLVSFFRTQVLSSTRYSLQSELNRLRALPVPAPRGLVLDRNGTVLAENGYSEALIGVLLGHAWASQHVTGRHYIRPRVNQLRAMLSSLDDWLRSGPKSAPSQAPSLQVIERE